ncbi:hypothetical protein [Micromonospora sp. LOL_023]|uniref:hypothetical protein n=1 Tax=Micromonospora sp. LOL_023 TaxID=3345418 RepID=UPI003A89F17E
MDAVERDAAARLTGVLLLGSLLAMLAAGLRRAGVAAAVEQLGYALHLPVMLWWGVFGWRQCRCGRVRRTATMPV